MAVRAVETMTASRLDMVNSFGGLDEHVADPVGDQCGLLLALDLDRDLVSDLPLAGALLLGGEHPEMAADVFAGFDRGHEAYLLEPVIDRHAHRRRVQHHA